jgi:hypothetical protein
VEKEGVEKGWYHFEMKDRECESLGKLKIGEFEGFGKYDSECCNNMFSLNLQQLAPCVLDFLSVCEKTPKIWNPDTLKKSCTLYYPAFLRLQAKHMNETLIPPLNIAIVWWTHMLQSSEYREFAESICPGLSMIPHCCFAKNKDTARTKELFKEAGVKYKKFAQKGLAEGHNERPVCGVNARDSRIQGIVYFFAQSE